MEPGKYREQFFEFLKVMYPEGLSLAVNSVIIKMESGNYTFYFDPQDFEQYRTGNTTKPGKPKAESKAFNAADKRWLKEMNIKS